MADVGPDPGLAQAKARLDIVTQQQKIAQYMHDLAQQQVQRQRTVSNLKASKAALDDCQERLDGLIETHGEIKLPLLEDFLA